jgi:transglutaminase-like putative cysteine protease
MEINVGCRLRFEIAEPTYVVFLIEAAKADSQIVRAESLVIPANSLGKGYDTYSDPVTLTRKLRTLLGPGSVEVAYDATVEVDASKFDPGAVDEYQFTNLPLEYLEYLAPSRYCPSDTFTEFADQTFGKLQRGHTRVTAICDWINDNISYQAGSTESSTNAADVFHGQKGVCRDFAHLGISLTRALGIPARYASVYADGLSPQDFHAVFQAYLFGPKGGEWFSFDPTRMSSVDSLVRIAAGRDAADVAFAWPQGDVQALPPEVWAEAQNRPNKVRTTRAVSG